MPHISNQITDPYKLNLILQTGDGFTNDCGCVHPRMTDMTNDNTDILIDRTLSSQIQLFANVLLRILIIQENVITYRWHIFGYGQFPTTERKFVRLSTKKRPRSLHTSSTMDMMRLSEVILEPI